MELGLAAKLGEMLASALISKGIDKLLKPREVKSVHEKIGIRLAVVVDIADALESDVNKILEMVLSKISVEKHPQLNFPMVKSNGDEYAISMSIYGSYDELREEEFDEITEYAMGLEKENDDVDILPTVSSITIFLYPVEIQRLETIQIGYKILIKIQSLIEKNIVNYGSKTFIVITVEKDKLEKLVKSVNKISSVKKIRIERFIGTNDNVGIQIIDPSDLELKEVLSCIIREFGGIIQRLKGKCE